MSLSADDVLIVVPARMGSSRLPGKTLMPLAGKPLLSHLLDSIGQLSGIRQVVATTVDPIDDPIESYCRQAGIDVFRGDRENVASRFFSLANTFRGKYLARISGDSPLFDFRILELAMNLAIEEPQYELFTTVSSAPYPKGMHVELIKRDFFLSSYGEFATPDHFEHVTKFYYESPERARIKGMNCPIENARSYSFVVDTLEDFNCIESCFSLFTQPHYRYSLQDKCSIYQKVKALPK